MMQLVLCMTVPLLYLILAGAALCVLTRKPFGTVLPAVLLFIPAVLYVSQFLFRSFLPGTVFLLILPAGAIPLFFLSTAEAREYHKKNIFSRGLYTLAAVWLLFLVIDMKRDLVKWDELMTWGMMVKEMFRTDRFYAEPVSNLLRHKDYPPFMGLLQLFWCRLCGGYTEMGVSMASHVFNLSLIAGPLAVLRDDAAGGCGGNGTRTGKNAPGKMLCEEFFFMLIVVTVLLAFDPSHVLMTIYSDITEAIVFAYAMRLVFTGDAMRPGFGLAAFVLALFGLVGIKQIGIAFLMLCLLYYFLTLCADQVCGKASVHGPEEKDAKQGIRWGCFAVSAAVPFLSMYVWERYTGQFEISRQFDLPLADIKAMKEIAGGALSLNANASGGVSLKETLVRFVLALFETNIWNGWIPVTFVSALFLYILVLVVLHGKNRERFPVPRALLPGIVFTVGTAGYAAMMLLLYLFCFEPEEVSGFSNYPRYMGSWLLGAVLVLAFIAAELYRDTLKRVGRTGTLALVWLICAVLLYPAGLLYFVPQRLHGNPRGAFRELAGSLSESVEPGASVFLVSDSSSDDTQLFTAYYADGIRISMEDIHAALYDYEGQPGLVAQVAESMGHNDYVYVVRAGEKLRKAFAAGDAAGAPEVLSESGLLEDGTLYCVEKEKGIVRLRKADKGDERLER